MTWVVNRYFLLGVTLSLFLSVAAVLGLFQKLYLVEIALGLMISIVNGFVASSINREAVLYSQDHSLFWGLAMNSFRLLLLICIIVLFNFLGKLNFMPFLAVVLISYFCLLFCEIIKIHTQSLERSELQ